jgi:hypothetical protein
MALIPGQQRWFLPRRHFNPPHIPFNFGEVAGSRDMAIARCDCSPQPPCKVTHDGEFPVGVPARGVW